MTYVPGLGTVSRRERYLADRFYESLTGVCGARGRASTAGRLSRRSRRPRQPRHPRQCQCRRSRSSHTFRPGAATSSRRAGAFTDTRGRLSSLPRRFCRSKPPIPSAVIDAALTAAGLNAAQRGRITRRGLGPDCGGIRPRRHSPELFARLRWSAADIEDVGPGRRQHAGPAAAHSHPRSLPRARPPRTGRPRSVRPRASRMAADATPAQRRGGRDATDLVGAAAPELRDGRARSDSAVERRGPASADAASAHRHVNDRRGNGTES